jgi:hypothetical protein
MANVNRNVIAAVNLHGYMNAHLNNYPGDLTSNLPKGANLAALEAEGREILKKLSRAEQITSGVGVPEKSFQMTIADGVVQLLGRVHQKTDLELTVDGKRLSIALEPGQTAMNVAYAIAGRCSAFGVSASFGNPSYANEPVKVTFKKI